MKFPTLSTLLLLSLLTTALATPVTDTAKDAQLDICQQTLSYNDLSAGLDKCGLTSDDNDYPTPEQLTCFCTIPQMDHHWAVYDACVSAIGDEEDYPRSGSFEDYCAAAATTTGEGVATAAGTKAAEKTNGAGVRRGGYGVVVAVLVAAWVVG